MNADIYVNILRENLPKIYKDDNYLIYDNDPKHTSTKAKKYLKDNNIKCLDFPPYSPDINPIENVWAELKRLMVYEKYVNSISDDFEETIIFAWDKIDQKFIKKIIDDMKKRLTLVIEMKGGYIN